MLEILWQILRFIIVKFLEPIYFSLFLIIGKDLKKKKLLFTFIMIFEYYLLTSIIQYDVLIQFIYTFLTFLTLKVLYKQKAQITDIFLFTFSSIILIIISIISYIIVIFNVKFYDIALIFNRILLFSFLYVFRKGIRNKYKEFYSLWNRHKNPNEIKSLTLRNISVITFNLMFWLINLGLIFVKIFS